MKTLKIRLSNDFHNSETTAMAKVIREAGQIITCELSARQVKRIQSELCGIGGCTCSNELGTRGSQYYNACDINQDGSAILYYNKNLAH